MAYLEGLRYNPGGSGLEETRGGVPVCCGAASGLQEWRFKVFQRRTRDDGTLRRGQASQFAEFLGKVIERLRNEASQVAMGISDDELRGEDAINVLVDRVENYAIRGLAARCHEPMTSYITRPPEMDEWSQVF